MKMVVWVDELFLNNLLITTLILWATARLTHLTFSWWRLLLAAILGSLYTIMSLYPFFSNLPLLVQLLSHLLLSLLLIYTAFVGTYKKLLQALGYLYLVTIIMGGAILASYHLLGGSPLRPFFAVARLYRGDLWLLLFGIIFLVFVGRYGLSIIHQHFWRGMFHLPLWIQLCGERVRLTGLVDTGNRLRDPLNNDPVIIVEWETLREILPLDQPLSSKTELLEMVSLLEDTPLSSRIRVIPFGALEGDGMLLGLRPDEVTIRRRGRDYSTERVVIGLLFQRLDSKGEYQALLHPEIYQSLIGESLHIDEVEEL